MESEAEASAALVGCAAGMGGVVHHHGVKRPRMAQELPPPGMPGIVGGLPPPGMPSMQGMPTQAIPPQAMPPSQGMPVAIAQTSA